ncbi:lamin tail domain-containing protein 2 [Orycteropus afer afer]|uniref:Lamin tail domain-containing protein 2 n=1 Tax=Orycteropus afer afer TaxID=1230840 RepID=A0A8B7AI27_ORYAF|nr:lamin tail domain-containing protein 2 [Orycteropus afer afer]
MAPTGQQDTKPQATRVFPNNPQAAPESLDPRTLRLLWGQRELEIQALRWAVQSGRDDRHNYILEEVAGLPPDRSSRNQEKVLQNLVQKLTLELNEQKNLAQLEKEQLEQRLQQTTQALQQLEEELQAFQKSCLLRLAASSWVGRILRSQTGSMEVVTAETLMDPSDSSESELPPTGGEGFQLKDVDWNSVAQRYPNLFTEAALSEHKQPRPPPQPPQYEWDSKSPLEHMQSHTNSVGWSALPLSDSSSSGTTDSDSRSSELSRPSPVEKVTGHPPEDLPHFSFKRTEAEKTLTTDVPTGPADLRKALVDQPKHIILPSEATEDCSNLPSGYRRRLLGSCLKIVAVNRREKFIRVLNQSLEETVNLDGFVLQQLVRNFPVCMYRFPPETLLKPLHHVTVWGEGASSTKKHPLESLGRKSVYYHSSRGFVTLLLNPKGEVLSEYQAPHCVTPVSKISDDTDLSIDRFPLSKDPPGADTCQRRCQSRPQHKGSARKSWAERWRQRTQVFLPHLRPNKPIHPREALGRAEGADTLEPLPTIPGEGVQARRGAGLAGRGPSFSRTQARPGLDHSQAREENTVRVCRKGVDRSCPMVALSVQRTAQSRFGFRFLCCPPITADSCGRV